MKTTIVQMCIFLICMAYTGVFAQEDHQFSQYMYNTSIFNPAYAGNRGVISVNAVYRSQWVGLDGAPTTQLVTVNGPVGRKKIGLGLNLKSDQIGVSKQQNATADVSYTLKVSEHMQLSFGARGGFQLLNVDFNQLNLLELSDQNFSDNISNELTPEVGVGIFLHGEQWYFGASAPNLLATQRLRNQQQTNVSERQTFYTMGGYVAQLSPFWKWKPALLTRFGSGQPVSLDLSTNFMFRERFTIGASYRLDAAFSGLAAFQISNTWLIGYAYDYDTIALGEFNSGSHELFIRLDFSRLTNGRIKTPRFF